MVLFSPPYKDARSYGGLPPLVGEAWVAHKVEVFQAALRVCKGLVACVCAGRTKDYRWSAVPALLMADLHRQGITLRNPAINRRVSIPPPCPGPTTRQWAPAEVRAGEEATVP
jgi:hypothetical protein